MKPIPFFVRCPRCGAEAGTQCKDVTKSYRRGRTLLHAHAERRAAAVKSGRIR